MPIPIKEPYLITISATFICLLITRLIFRISDSAKPDVKQRQKKAQELVDSGDLAAAADIYRETGVIDRAIELYIHAKAYAEAAYLLQQQHRLADASALLIRSGDYCAAAELLCKGGDFPAAAENYLRADMPLKSAEMYEKAGALPASAREFEKVGDFRKAAEMYSRGKNYSDAGRMMELCYDDERQRNKSGGTRSLINLAYYAGSFYRAAGNFPKAANMFEKEGLYADAADSFARSGAWQAAASSYRSAGMPGKAAKALEKAGGAADDLTTKAEMMLEAGRKSEAANFFASAGDFVRAAKLKAELGELEAAAGYYVNGGMSTEAAELFEKAGLLEKAAEAYEEALNFPKSADLYLKSGNNEKAYLVFARMGRYLEAGEGLLSLGQLDNALQMLQQIPEGDESYNRALTLMGEVFFKKNILGAAKDKLIEAIADRPINKETLEAYYNLSLIEERNNDKHQALKILEKIIGINYNFKDSAARAENIRTDLSMASTLPDNQMPKPIEQPAKITGPTSTSPAISPTVLAQAPRPAATEQNERYEIMEKLGQGGSGVVYKARDTFLDRIVAYKVLTSGGHASPQELENFQREAKAAASLNHPNIVTVYDAGINADQFYITMEYIDGPNLRELVEQHGQLPLTAVMLMVGQTSRALDYAHSHMIVHRDVKNSNLLWMDNKTVKIVDFGLAKFLRELKNLQTVWGGTPYYMPPEQILGEQVDHRSDIYSFGVSMFELATGQLPFTQGDVGYHHVHTPAPDPREVRPDIPMGMAMLIMKCLNKAPRERHQSMADIFNELKTIKL